MRDLCATAVDTAIGAGAEYADARAVVRSNQFVTTKNGRVEQLADAESEGIGVRVLVNGAWGFACDRRLSAEGAREAALRAYAFAKATGGRRATAAVLSFTSGVFLVWIALVPFRRGERWAWRAVATSLGLGALLSILRLPMLDTRLGAGAAVFVLVWVVAALLVSYRDFK